MKKTTEKTEQTSTKKRAKRNNKFFLYTEGKGFIRLNENDTTGMPNFENGEPLFFETRAKAIFARDFFLSVGLAKSIDILAKVA